MGYEIQQGQTAHPLLFLLIDETDHISGLASASPTVTISKNGASFGSPAGAVAEISAGWYKVAADAGDADTLGPLLLHATATGADDCDELFRVVAYNPDDATRLGLAALPNAAADAAGGLAISDAGGLDLDALDTAVAAILTDTGTTLDGKLDAIQAGTDNLPPDPADESSLEAYIDAAVAGLSTLDGSGVLSALTAQGYTATRADYLDNLDAAVSTRLADGDYTAPPTVGDVADAVWDEVSSGHETSGTTGAKLAAASAAGDPWETDLPGAYGDGTAGAIIGALADGGGATPAEIWAYSARTLTQSAAGVLAAVSGSTLAWLRGDVLAQSITGLGTLAGRTKLVLTIKRDVDDADADALLQIEESDGILVWLGAVPEDILDGSLTVDDEDAGDVTLALAGSLMAQLPVRTTLHYDIQMILDGEPVTVTQSTCRLQADVTRATA
jgi:hypothetical protein